MPRVPKTLIKALNSSEVAKILDEFDGRDFKSVRNRAITMLFIDTGLRLSELANIQLEDINVERQTILVTGKGNKQRMVRFGVRTAKTLWRYISLRNSLNGHSGALWLEKHGDEVKPNCIALVFKRLQQKTGIKVHCHRLRHTYAISALRNGMNPFVLQASLGHATLDMTRRYCQSLSFEDVYREHQKASPIDNIK
ncbi:MAG: tyrosine-type recombinase/integrase [Chloroflexi bacterium]|nr:tyrosine-type recombinase/integrase [Chloroflexota bacterium]